MTLGPPPSFKHFRNDNNRALLSALRLKVAPILANNLLPHFTDHTVDHSDHVVAHVDTLLDGANPSPTDSELLILYSACYLHDIGMQYECAGNTKVIQSLNLPQAWDELTDAERRELLRHYHHRISAELVQASVNTATPPIGFQLTPEFNAPYIAQLCHAHCIPTDTEEYNLLVSDAPNIRMSLLSAILRIGDILDESRRRATREKARTLSLNTESQTHWWRHYYTEDVVFDANQRTITIWFDFPHEMCEEYSRIVPELQMPWIEAELSHHNGVLLRNQCQWSARHRSRSTPYSTAARMPDDVQMAMLGQLVRRRRLRDEAQRVAELTTFREARPAIQRRLLELRERESVIDGGEYLRELSRIAIDLYELGGKQAARNLLHFRFLNDLQHLSLQDRISIGLELLRWQVDANRDHNAMQLLNKLDPDFEALATSDDRKVHYTLLKIQALNCACAYHELRAAITEAGSWIPESARLALITTSVESALLQGDFESSEM
ncbi:MAG: hypothetical protein U1A77_00065 [Pirellulales bacterium]